MGKSLKLRLPKENGKEVGIKKLMELEDNYHKVMVYIFISVAPHRIFQRDGANIFCRVPLSMADASLGADIEVPTVDGGRAKVKIPPGSQTGQQFRLRNKGMAVLQSAGRGDMYIEMMVETPVNLTKKQRELLEEFRKESKGHATSPESDGFFSKVKEFWDDLTEWPRSIRRIA